MFSHLSLTSLAVECQDPLARGVIYQSRGSEVSGSFQLTAGVNIHRHPSTDSLCS